MGSSEEAAALALLGHPVQVMPSVRLALALSTAHLAAAVLPWLAPIPLPGKAVLTVAVAVSLIYFMARDATLHAAHSIVALEITNGGISCRTRRGDWLECELLGSSYVSPRLTIVNLRPRGQRGTRRVILVADNVEPRDFRRLRMWLRWKGRENLTKR